MGTLFGHVYEGLIFVFVGLWWMYNAFKRQLLRQPYESYNSSVSYVCSLKGKTFNWEVYAKVFGPIFGIGIETGVVQGVWLKIDTPTFQHISIYALFLLHGIIDWLEYKGLLVIDTMNYLTLSLCYGWYGMIFYFHTQTEFTQPLEDIIHTLGVAWCIGTAVSIFWESRTSDKFLASYLRSFFLLCLGTWFTQMPFILYSHERLFTSLPNPNWDRGDINNVQLAATMFGIHLLVNTAVSVAMFILLRVVYRKSVSELALYETKYSKLQTRCSDNE